MFPEAGVHMRPSREYESPSLFTLKNNAEWCMPRATRSNIIQLWPVNVIRSCHENIVPENPIGNALSLVQVIVGAKQAIMDYLNQRWPVTVNHRCLPGYQWTETEWINAVDLQYVISVCGAPTFCIATASCINYSSQCYVEMFLFIWRLTSFDKLLFYGWICYEFSNSQWGS